MELLASASRVAGPAEAAGRDYCIHRQAIDGYLCRWFVAAVHYGFSDQDRDQS